MDDNENSFPAQIQSGGFITKNLNSCCCGASKAVVIDDIVRSNHSHSIETGRAAKLWASNGSFFSRSASVSPSRSAVLAETYLTVVLGTPVFPIAATNAACSRCSFVLRPHNARVRVTEGRKQGLDRTFHHRVAHCSRLACHFCAFRGDNSKCVA